MSDRVVIVREPSPPRSVRVTELEHVVIQAAARDGRDGADGVDGGSYRHVQGVASATWTITHNLGYRPNVAAFENVGGSEGWQEIEGNIDHVSDNELTISFNALASGEAYLS